MISRPKNAGKQQNDVSLVNYNELTVVYVVLDIKDTSYFIVFYICKRYQTKLLTSWVALALVNASYAYANANANFSLG